MQVAFQQAGFATSVIFFILLIVNLIVVSISISIDCGPAFAASSAHGSSAAELAYIGSESVDERLNWHSSAVVFHCDFIWSQQFYEYISQNSSPRFAECGAVSSLIECWTRSCCQAQNHVITAFLVIADRC
jgi:hypothetical protein